MPTHDEQKELIDNCTLIWTNINGVYGRLFTSKRAGYTDKSIFLPAAGHGDDNYLGGAGSGCYLWSSTFCADRSAWILYSNSVNDIYTIPDYRYFGLTVRPVTE